MKVYLLNRVENIVAKGDIAYFEQCFLLQQFFQKSSAAEASEIIYMLERVKFFSRMVYVNVHCYNI